MTKLAQHMRGEKTSSAFFLDDSRPVSFQMWRIFSCFKPVASHHLIIICTYYIYIQIRCDKAQKPQPSAPRILMEILLELLQKSDQRNHMALEFFKNSAILYSRSPDKILTEEVECQRKLCLYKDLHFILLHFIFVIFLFFPVRILSVQQTEFFFQEFQPESRSTL